MPRNELSQTIHNAKRVEARRQEKLAEAKQAKLCECEEPVTYLEEDGEKRCVCGREVR